MEIADGQACGCFKQVWFKLRDHILKRVLAEVGEIHEGRNAGGETVYQFERNIMLERQREGTATAKAKGRYKVRPKTIDRSAILTLLDENVSMRLIDGKLGVSLSTVQRIKMENLTRFRTMDRQRVVAAQSSFRPA